MTGFAERFIEQGKQEGIQQGVQQGVQQGIQEVIQHQRHMLARQIRNRFGEEAAEASDPLLAGIDDPKKTGRPIRSPAREPRHRRLAAHPANRSPMSARSTPKPSATSSS